MQPHLRLRLGDDAPEVRRGAVDGPHALDQRPQADDESGDAQQDDLTSVGSMCQLRLPRASAFRIQATVLTICALCFILLGRSGTAQADRSCSANDEGYVSIAPCRMSMTAHRCQGGL